jgi:tetratricopeptide (TPR) repeat protein
MTTLGGMTRIVLGLLLILAFPGRLPSQNAVDLTRQGLELMNQGLYREAEGPLLRALDLAGPANPTALYNLATLYHRQEAERLHRLALKQLELQHGPFHPDFAQSLNDLGAIYRSAGRYSQAIAFLERAMRILEANPSHESIPTVLNNLAAVYSEMGEYAKAEDIAKRALAIAESRRQEGQSAAPYTLITLGRVYLAREQDVDAELAFRESISQFARTLGVRHPDYAIAQSYLALLYQRQKRFREALPPAAIAVEILEQTFGRESPVLALPLERYSEVLKGLGRQREAREIARRARSIVNTGGATVDVQALRRRSR